MQTDWAAELQQYRAKKPAIPQTPNLGSGQSTNAGSQVNNGTDWAAELQGYRANKQTQGAGQGGTDWASELNAYRQRKQNGQAKAYDPNEGMSGMDKFLVSAGRGFTDFGEGVVQTGLAIGEKLGFADEGAEDAYVASKRGDRELYDKHMGDSAIATAGRITGNALPWLAGTPLRAASTVGKLAASAATGAGVGATQFVDEEHGDSRLANTLLGAGFGAGGTVAAGALSRVAGKAINTVKGNAGNPAAREVLEAGREHNIPVYAQDVSNNPLLRSATTTAEQIPIVGLGGARQTQQNAARNAAERFRDQFADVGENTGEVVQDSLSRKTNRLKKIAGRKYDRVEQLADPLGPVTLPKLQNIVQDLAEEQASIPDIAGTRAGANAILQQLDQLSQSNTFNFSQLRSVRSDLGKSIRELERSNGEGRFERLRLLQQAKNAITEDLDEFANRSNSGRLKRAWRQADTFYRDRVVPQRARDIQKAASNLNPDEAYKSFIKAGTNQDRAKRLYDALDRNGRRAVRYGIIKDAYQKALREGLEGEVFSPAKFAGALERIQGATGVFFKGADKQQLDGLVKVMRHVQRSGQFTENPPTGNRLLGPMLMGGGVADIALTGGIFAAKGAASALVLRVLTTTSTGINLLIASSRLKDGSPRLANLIKHFETRLPALLTTSAVGA